jgi:hypothetical protein
MSESGDFSFRTEEWFAFRNKEWHCAVRFYPDRLEYLRDAWGLGVDKGSEVFARSELAQKLSEYSGAGRLAPRLGRLPGVYLVLAMFSYLLLPSPWRYSTIAFLILFSVSLFSVLKTFKRRDWLIIKTTGGRSAVSVQVTGWPEEKRENFRKVYDDFMKGPNQLPDPTSPSVTPPAGAGAAPSVAADH